MHSLTTKSVPGASMDLPMLKPISNKDLLELEVSVLFPSALENVITRENASKIRCKILCELANGPTTPSADDILYEKAFSFCRISWPTRAA
jgi:glutamate dehydrogenase (NAD(P)+)